MGYRKVLVTLDGSKLAEKAVEHVVNVATPEAQITLLSIVEDAAALEAITLASSVGAAFSIGTEWPNKRLNHDLTETNARKTYLKTLSDWLVQAGYTVTVDVREGDVVETILKAANEGYEVVIMATHGRTGLGKLALGSITESVLEQAHCPVFVIPARAGAAVDAR